MTKLIPILLIVVLAWCSHPALAQEADDEFDDFNDIPDIPIPDVHIADPLKPINRLMFNLNHFLYRIAIKPVTQGYKKIMPEPARNGVRNLFGNLTAPIRYVNCVLQGKLGAANREFERFAVNSTVGVLGLSDPAEDKLGLKPTNEDLGQTLAVHGIGHGPYIVWPLFGPSSLRDSVGGLGDRLFYPVTHFVDSPSGLIGISAARTLNFYSFYIREYDALVGNALDPYIMLRSSYVQHRNGLIHE